MEIRFVRVGERTDLMDFIDKHWREGHILSWHEQLFDWQYMDLNRLRYNFIAAVDDDGNFQAILGFIPLSQFDPAIDIACQCWLAIWKVTDAAAGQGLGRRLLEYLDAEIGPKVIAANAISPSATHRYRQAGYTIGKLDHWFIINPHKARFELAAVPDEGVSGWHAHRDPPHMIEGVSAEKFFADFRWCGPKTATYYLNRYFRHPIYSYDAYRIHSRRRTQAMFIARTCHHMGATAMRIVDYAGPADALTGTGEEWRRLLGVTGDEYVDFYNVGIDREHLEAAGFRLRRDGDGFVVPNYYEPFVRGNIEIETMVSVKVDPQFRIFKGDSDQDRPNEALT